MKQYLIFDIGGTFVKWALIKQDYKIIENSKWSFNGKEEGSKILIEKIKEKIKEIQKEKQIDGIGISVPGIVDPVSSKIVGENINIKDMNGLDFKKELQGLINGEIIVENDANAAVLGETTTDELKNCKNLLMITLGTGIGGGIIIDNQIYHGSSGMAGEIGNHIYQGNRWEWYHSSIGLIRMIKDNTGLEMTTYEILESKDNKIKELLNEWYKGIAHVLANMIIIMNFEAIVIGGGISESPHFDLELIQKNIINLIVQNQFHNSFKLYKAKLGNSAAIVGMTKLLNARI